MAMTGGPWSTLRSYTRDPLCQGEEARARNCTSNLELCDSYKLIISFFIVTLIFRRTTGSCPAVAVQTESSTKESLREMLPSSPGARSCSWWWRCSMLCLVS